MERRLGLSHGRSAGGTTKLSHPDRLGTNAKTTDASGSVVDSKRYDAFGLPRLVSNAAGSQAGFASAFGYQEDAESGLKLLGHRYYDAATGRFITRDPAQAGSNWYAYCDNNPLSNVDETGLNLTVIGSHDGVEFWDGIAKSWFGVGGKTMEQPSKAALIEALIEEDGDVMIWAHGGAGYINTGSGESLNAEDVRYIARERKRRGKGKLKRVWLRACHTCEDKEWVNAWLGASDEVFGYTSITTDGPIQNWRYPVLANPTPQNWWWSSSKKRGVKKKSKAKASGAVGG